MTIEPADWIHIVWEGFEPRMVWDPMDQFDLVFVPDVQIDEHTFKVSAKGYFVEHYVTFDPGEMN